MVDRKSGERAQTRVAPLLLVCGLIGLGAGAYFYYRATHPATPAIAPAEPKLAESTLAVLKALDKPVELSFYASLDPASTSDALRAFAGRTEQLLARYEIAGAGKIKVTHHTKPADAGAATAAGIKFFNIEKGDACFLGVVVIGNDRKETLAQLAPDWEAALESDLSRAIARVGAAAPAGRAAVGSAPPPDAATIAEVKRTIPNLETVTLAEGRELIRAAALQEIKEATEQLQQRITAAQQQGGEAAKAIPQLQAEQTAKLKVIAARSQARIEALEQIKGK